VPIGGEHSSLTTKDVDVAARKMGYTASPDTRPEGVFFFRSNQYSFAKQGVPVVKMSE
jgi:Zn-dependent M28 family amino/carboxypeptidase